jgi:hypothetical protein
MTISFTPQREGLFEATLELTFRDHSRKVDFVVKRTLLGSAERPSSGNLKSRDQSGAVHTDDEVIFVGEDEFLDNNNPGISASMIDGVMIPQNAVNQGILSFYIPHLLAHFCVTKDPL